MFWAAAHDMILRLSGSCWGNAMAFASQISFAGQVVLVTGSTTGIGEACARAFAAAGAAVMVSGRNADRGRAVVASIEAEGGTARFIAVDMRGAGECERLV